MIFDRIDFSDEKTYPAKKTIQWKCLHRLISQQAGNGKMQLLAKLGECDKSTLSKALKKTLSKKQSIVHISIAKRFAKKLKNPQIIAQLCPEYKEVEDF